MLTPTEARTTKVFMRVRTECRRLEVNLAKLSQEDMPITGVVGQ